MKSHLKGTKTFFFSIAVLIVLLAGQGLAFASNSPSVMPPHPLLREKAKLIKESLGIDYAAIAFPKFSQGIEAPSAKAPRLSGQLTGDQRALVLLVDFADKTAITSAGYFDTLVFGNAPIDKSVRNYYKEISYNQMDLVTVNLPSSLGWFRAPRNYSYYVNNQYGLGPYPRNAQKLVEDVVTLADPYVDFSQYDNDGNGYVDALFVVHAGPGAEFTGRTSDIWSHKWSINPKLVDGVRVSDYSMEPEYWLNSGDMTRGVFAHELGHVFGLPDLYDYGYDSEGLGDWSLMASGSWNGYLGDSPAHPDAWSLSQLGFIDPVNVMSSLVGQSINAVETTSTNSVFRLWTNGALGPEYFLVENRQKLGTDASLPGSGLIVYHVDETMPNNDNQNHYLVDIEEAHGGVQHLQADLNQGDAGDPFPGTSLKRIFSGTTDPNSNSYGGTATSVAVSNISNSGLIMTADLSILLDYGLNLDVLLNQTSFRTGQTLRARAHVTNDSTADTVRAVVWVVYPNGTTRTVRDNPNQTIPAGADFTTTLFNYTFNGSEPSGAYQVGAKFLDRNTGAIITQDIEAFNFQP